MEDAVNKWNDTHPDRTVLLDQLVIGYPQLRNKLITSAGAGTPPDISLVDSVWLAEFAEAGHLASLNEIDPSWYQADYRSDFFPVFQRGDMFEGSLWGVRTQTDMAVLWYRKDWFAALNMDTPESWKDIIRIGKRFQEKEVRERFGNGPFPLALPLGQKARETLVYQLLPLFWSNGGGVFDDGALILDSKENIETLQFLRDLVDAHELVQPEAVTYDWNRSMKLFAAGRVAMAFGGTYEKRMIQEITDWEEDEFYEKVGYALIPGGPHGAPATTAGGMCYVIYAESKNKRLAMEIVKLATSFQNMKDFMMDTYQHPPRVSIAEQLSKEHHRFLAETAGFLYEARPRPNFPDYTSLSDSIQEMVENVVRGSVSPDAAVKETSREIRSLMSGSR